MLIWFILHILALYTNFDLLCSSRHRDPPWSNISNGSDDTMTGVIHKPCNSADHAYSINDHTTESWWTADIKSQGNTWAWEELCYAAGQHCLYLFNLHVIYKYFSVCPTVEKTIRAISCLYETVHPSSNRFGTGNNMQMGAVLWQQLQHLDSTVDR